MFHCFNEQCATENSGLIWIEPELVVETGETWDGTGHNFLFLY